MTRFVGLDLGGTKVAAAVLTLHPDGEGGRLSVPIQQPTVLSSSAELVSQLAAIVEEVRDSAGAERIDAVGIGVPSVVDFASGRVVHSVNIPLADVALRSVLGDRLGVPIYVDNDATVAALAEAHDASLRLVSRHLVMLTIGTGVGAGLVLNGRIYRGSTGGAAEVGHTLIGMPISPAAPAAGFPEHLPDDFPPAGAVMPHPGSLEALASGHALDHLAVSTGVGQRGSDVVEAARAGSEPGQALVRRWAHAIGIGIANAINMFDPGEVVIGGGAAAGAGALFMTAAQEFAEGYIHPGLRGHANVRLARFGAQAGVMGAALLAANEFHDAPVMATPAGE